MYPQAIEEWKASAQLLGERRESEYVSALEQGFRSAGWKGALTRGIAVRLAQNKEEGGASNAYQLARLYSVLGEKDPERPSFPLARPLDHAYRERIMQLTSLKTEGSFDSLRSDPRYAELVRKIGFPQ